MLEDRGCVRLYLEINIKAVEKKKRCEVEYKFSCSRARFIIDLKEERGVSGRQDSNGVLAGHQMASHLGRLKSQVSLRQLKI